MEYSTSAQLETQMESESKDVVTKEELNDHYSLLSNVGDRIMQSENGKISKDSVKEEISTKTKRTECQQANYVVKTIASGDTESESDSLGTLLLPVMPLSTSLCQRSTIEKKEETKMSEFMDGAPLDMSVSPLTYKASVVSANSVHSTSSLKLANKAKRLDALVSNLIKLKNNCSTVRPTSCTDPVKNAHSIREYGSEDHEDRCSSGDAHMNDEGYSKQNHVGANPHHGKDNHDGDQYTCLDCPASFETNAAFKKHIASHEGYRRHKCTMCEKRSSTKQHLMVHMLRPEGEKPFKCDVCKKKFTTSSNLNLHKRIHTGIKPFKCDVCEKGFTRRETLETHKRIHTGEKPFKCDICNKDSVTSSELKRHKRVHSGEKPYKCPICGERFSRKDSLQKHKHRHHIDTDEDTKPDVSNLLQLPSSSPQADASRERSPMEDIIITD